MLRSIRPWPIRALGLTGEYRNMLCGLLLGKGRGAAVSTMSGRILQGRGFARTGFYRHVDAGAQQIATVAQAHGRVARF
jgi:hypothetical protein